MRHKETEGQKEMRRFEKETTLAYVITHPDAVHLARGFRKVSTEMAIVHNETSASVSGVYMHRRGKLERDLYRQFRYGLLIRLREKVDEIRGKSNE
jgi:hypothetical protein